LPAKRLGLILKKRKFQSTGLKQKNINEENQPKTKEGKRGNCHSADRQPLFLHQGSDFRSDKKRRQEKKDCLFSVCQAGKDDEV